ACCLPSSSWALCRSSSAARCGSWDESTRAPPSTIRPRASTPTPHARECQGGKSPPVNDGSLRIGESTVNRRIAALRARLALVRQTAEAGMATAEYAIATLAAAGFAGLLYVILRSDQVRGFLVNIINQALTVG